MNLNKVQLIGRVGQQPTIRETAKGKVCNVSLATNSGYGAKKETDWHRLTFFDRLAETVEEFVTKGQELYVEGRIKYNKWTDKEGVEKYGTDILVNKMELGSNSQQGHITNNGIISSLSLEKENHPTSDGDE